jgi:hypothetical protein
MGGNTQGHEEVREPAAAFRHLPMGETAITKNQRLPIANGIGDGVVYLAQIQAIKAV